MRRTDQQIVTQIRTLISQTDSTNSDFSDSELLGFANETLQFIATRIEWPRDITDIQVSQGTAAYTLPNDTIKIRTAYFGDTSIANKVYPLSILTEEQLREKRPQWLDQSSAAQGSPNTVILLDRQTALINPTPDATNSATGMKLILGYVYFPAAMSGNGDYPDLPDNFHDEIKFYAGHLCYMGKLKNPDLANKMLDTMIKKLDLMKPSNADQIDEKGFGWGNYEGDGGPDRLRIANYQL